MLLARAVLLLPLLLAACGDLWPREAHREDRAEREATRSVLPVPLRVRVMTFNLRWDGFDDGLNAWAQRRELAYGVLRHFGPDSVGTQEPRVRQIDDVQRAIPTLHSFRFDNDPVYVRTQQILFHQERLERMDGGGFLLSDGSNEDGTVRYCTWVRLRQRATGRTYRHYNVHLDHRSARSRQQAAVRLVAHIAARTEGDPFVVTGDFNAGEKSPTLAFLRGERTLPGDDGAAVTNPIPLADTFRMLHPDASEVGTGSGWHGKRTGGKIDFVLVATGGATVHEAEIVRTNRDGRYPSDHFPVTAVIEWP